MRTWIVGTCIVAAVKLVPAADNLLGFETWISIQFRWNKWRISLQTWILENDKMKCSLNRVVCMRSNAQTLNIYGKFAVEITTEVCLRWAPNGATNVNKQNSQLHSSIFVRHYWNLLIYNSSGTSTFDCLRNAALCIVYGLHSTLRICSRGAETLQTTYRWILFSLFNFERKCISRKLDYGSADAQIDVVCRTYV